MRHLSDQAVSAFSAPMHYTPISKTGNSRLWEGPSPTAHFGITARGKELEYMKEVEDKSLLYIKLVSFSDF